MSRRTKAEALLILVTFIWGSTFVVVKRALSDASPLPFLSARFFSAGILLSLLLEGRRGLLRAPAAIHTASGRSPGSALVPGSILGLFLFGGFCFQTYGQAYTTPSKCAFITGFSVILVPVIMAFCGSRMRGASIAGALLGLSGLYLLVLPSGLDTVNRGDVLTLIAAIGFAIHIVLVGMYTRRHSFRRLVPIQILVVGLLATVLLPVDSGRRFHLTPQLGGALAVSALLSTAFAFSVQNWAQQYTPAAHTALIFALEPVFAALSSRVVMGEHLGGRVLLGSALILLGMVISEMWGGTIPTPVEG